jgi:hypothetical protein
MSVWVRKDVRSCQTYDEIRANLSCALIQSSSNSTDEKTVQTCSVLDVKENEDHRNIWMSVLT